MAEGLVLAQLEFIQQLVASVQRALYYTPGVVSGAKGKEKQNSLSPSRRDTLENGWDLFCFLCYHQFYYKTSRFTINKY